MEDERTSERAPSLRRVIADEVTINLFQVVRRLLPGGRVLEVWLR